MLHLYDKGLWCLTHLSTMFQLYHGGQFYWWRKLSNFITQCYTEYHMITSVKLVHTMLYRVPYDHDRQT
jgi:hypothetical protein